MKVLVLNSPDDAGRIYGSALERDGIIPVYVQDSLTPSSILDSEAPDLVLLSLEWLPFQRIISAEARSRGIPVIYVMDGILEWSYVWNNQSFVFFNGTVLQPLLASHICVIGRHPARILASMGLADKINVIGLPRLDHFSRTRLVTANEPPILLICSAKTASHNNDHYTSVIHAFLDIKELAESLGIVCVWRIAEDLAKAVGVERNEAPLEDVLSKSSALITTPSTVALEGMLAGLPTAILEYRPVPIYIETAWQIRSRDHIRTVINELLYPPPERMAYQEFCLGEELQIGSASTKLFNLMRDAVADTRESSEKMTSAPYGALDYKLVHSQVSTFSSSSLTALQYAADAYARQEGKLVEWKAELLDTWPIRLIRSLRNMPMLKRINRLLDRT